MGCDGVQWVDLVKDRANWWALVGAVTKFRVP